MSLSAPFGFHFYCCRAAVWHLPIAVLKKEKYRGCAGVLATALLCELLRAISLMASRTTRVQLSDLGPEDMRKRMWWGKVSC